jgi:short-subunit dehydrogenase
MNRLTGKRVLMTGANLVLSSRTAGKIGRLAQELRAQGFRAEPIAADFTRNEDVDRLRICIDGGRI